MTSAWRRLHTILEAPLLIAFDAAAAAAFSDASGDAAAAAAAGPFDAPAFLMCAHKRAHQFIPAFPSAPFKIRSKDLSCELITSKKQ